jgi:hypothetical protein
MTEDLKAWVPPAGMLTPVVKDWRAFYRTVLVKYGVTPQFYRQMYLAQCGRCYICQKAKGIHPDDPKGGGTRRLAVDHNHVIGDRIEAVRGLLCSGSLSANTCNRLIARYTAYQLDQAASYLRRPPAQQLLRLIAINGELPDQALIGAVM